MLIRSLRWWFALLSGAIIAECGRVEGSVTVITARKAWREHRISALSVGPAGSKGAPPFPSSVRRTLFVQKLAFNSWSVVLAIETVQKVVMHSKCWPLLQKSIKTPGAQKRRCCLQCASESKAINHHCSSICWSSANRLKHCYNPPFIFIFRHLILILRFLKHKFYVWPWASHAQKTEYSLDFSTKLDWSSTTVKWSKPAFEMLNVYVIKLRSEVLYHI